MPLGQRKGRASRPVNVSYSRQVRGNEAYHRIGGAHCGAHLLHAMAGLQLPVPLDQLITTSKVEVVQTLNAEALQATLRWIVDKLGSLAGSAAAQPEGDGGPDSQQQQEQLTTTLQQLKDKNALLQDAVNSLKAQQDALQQQLAASVTPAASTDAGEQASSPVPKPPQCLGIAGWEARVAALEQQLQDVLKARHGAGNHQQPGSSSSGSDLATTSTALDPNSADQLAEILQRLAGLEAQQLQPHPQQVTDGMPTALLAEHVAALERRLARLEAAADQQGGADTATAQQPLPQQLMPALQTIAKDEDGFSGGLQAAIQDLQQQLSRKADKGALDALAHEMRNNNRPRTPQVAAIANSAESVLPSAAPVAEVVSSAADVDTDQLAGRVFDLETAVGDVGVALRRLQGALDDDRTRVQQLATKMEDQDVVINGKADQSVLDKLQLQIALARSATGGPATHGDSHESVDDNLLGALHGLVADKATKAEFDALRKFVAARPTHDEVKQMMTAYAASAEAMACRPSTPEPTSVLLSPRLSSPAAAADVLKLATDTEAFQPASKSELDMLAQQIGDQYADLSDLRGQLFALQHAQLLNTAPVGSTAEASAQLQVAEQQAGRDQQLTQAEQSAPSAPQPAATMPAAVPGHLPIHAGLQLVGNRVGGMHSMAVQQLQQELAVLRDQLDCVAHAACLMAVGQQGVHALHTAGRKSAVADSTATVEPAIHKASSQGATSRLAQLLAAGRVSHKMDWFDPNALNKLAGKLALLEDMSRRGTAANNNASGAAQVDPMVVRDLEAQLRRLSKDVRGLKDRAGDGSITGVQGSLLRQPDSDYAMLSGKKLLDGYRCMACDRPLDKLQDAAGPYIPTGQMPVRVPPSQEAAKVAQLRVPVVGHVPSDGSNNTPANKFTRKPGFDAATQRGPQNWYEDAKGLPADALPVGDVGPRLPPGGWRAGSVSGAVARPGSLLPDVAAAHATSPPSTAAGSKPARINAGQQQQQPLDVQDNVAIHAGLLPSLA